MSYEKKVVRAKFSKIGIILIELSIGKTFRDIFSKNKKVKKYVGSKKL